MTVLKTQIADQSTPDEEAPAQRIDNNLPPALRQINIELASLYEGPLTGQEIKSVTAVVAYIAYKNEISEETVLSILTTAFGVNDIKELERDYYDEAIRYLVDFRFDEAFN